MTRLILFNKPFGILSQFTGGRAGQDRGTLSEFLSIPDVYGIGNRGYGDYVSTIHTEAISACRASCTACPACNRTGMNRFIVRIPLKKDISHGTRVAVRSYLANFGAGAFEIDEDDSGPFLLAESRDGVELLKRQFPMVLAAEQPMA